jgi:methylmalonyl-CoA mutase C-terminal domain/subunit
MLGLDVHTKGIRTLAFRLREYGCEVIFFGEHLTAKALAKAAIAEDVDLIGVSFSSGAYVDHCRDLLKEMAAQDGGRIPLMIGGLIHADDRAALNEMGIMGIFGPDSKIEDIVAFTAATAKIRRDSNDEATPAQEV